jgi:4-hydroxy-3-methylbut-2-en-1-yl diphosphate reductase
MSVAERTAARPRAGAAALLAPLRIEARALRRGAPAATVVRTGMRSGAVPPGDGPLVVAGFAGALTGGLDPGALVVATEVAGPRGDVLPCDADVARLLADVGAVRTGRVATAAKIVRGSARSRLAETDALCVDLESYWLRRAAGERPCAVVRVVVDTPARELMNPLATIRGGIVAYRALTGAASVLAGWASGAEASYAQ